MPQFMVLQADPLPTVGGDPDNYAVYRVNAADAGAAAIAVATRRKETGPLVLHVMLQSAVTRYTTTPTTSYTAVPG